MKLNHDCIRDVLLYLEDALTISQSGKLKKRLHGRDLPKTPQLSKYSSDDIYYSCSQLYQSKFIEIMNPHLASRPYNYRFVDITPAGHRYLNSVRDPKIWRALKDKLGDISTFLLTVLAQKACRELPALAASLQQLPPQ